MMERENIMKYFTKLVSIKTQWGGGGGGGGGIDDKSQKNQKSNFEKILILIFGFEISEI